LEQHYEEGTSRHHWSGIWSGISHSVKSLVGAHSHDHADSVDSALESSARGTQALVVSFSVLMATAIVQLAIVAVTGSVALLADTIHNFSDALTAVPLFIAFRVGRRAANRSYTYGYRRAEDIAGLFVVLMILSSAILVAWESIQRLILA
jgi:divalent metal cation (Fe/Co/Zn/Cd) transporter